MIDKKKFATLLNKFPNSRSDTMHLLHARLKNILCECCLENHKYLSSFHRDGILAFLDTAEGSCLEELSVEMVLTSFCDFFMFIVHISVDLFDDCSRYWTILLLEILIPTIIIIALGGIRVAVKPSIEQESIPSTFNYAEPLDSMYTSITCGNQNLVWSQYDQAQACSQFKQPRKIAVAPSDSSNTAAVQATSEFVNWINQHSAYALNYSTFEIFSSESSFLDILDSAKYSIDPSIPIYSSAVIFSEGYPNWDYTVRLNKTYCLYDTQYTSPPTLGPNLDISMQYNSQSSQTVSMPYDMAYLNTGVYALMNVVNSFISNFSCQSLPNGCNHQSDIVVQALGVADFPNPQTSSTQFWTAMGSIFALLMIISLLYPLANVIKSLVTEKETKIREGMLMMAMRGDALWVSWYLNFIFLFVPLSIILAFAGKLLFVYSNTFFLFLYFLLFFLSATSYAIFISMFFSRARTASIVGCIIFFLGFFIYVGMQSATVGRSAIMAACLHPATAFTYGTLAFIEYEDARIGVTQNTWNVSQTYVITFQDTLNMMFIDAIYLLVISWYIDSIWPSEFGTHKPWYFIFMPNYWLGCLKSVVGCCCSLNYPPIYERVSQNTRQSEGVEMVAMEAIPENLQAQIEAKTCIDIQNLVKTFNTNTGLKTAVDHLSLTMFSGQITSLLGHNGAGKSTTIAMLTGLISPDEGTAFIGGRDVNIDMDEIRKDLGVCPQHDILFPDMTVEEHLIMFASFKGIPKAELNAEVEKMIQSVGLTEKRKTFSKHLSGGQKRKLSVAIAFVGGSKYVILDEPTSGMDPYSRRFTWNIIRQHREGRVIILTTHFMDEADILGDRIAIMGDGKLLCCGSSLFLKKTFGVGYNMTIEKQNATSFNSQAMEEFVHGCVPEAKVLTNVGTEMTFQLPFSSSHSFQKMFECFDVKSEEMQIQSYGMSVTTLEEVFIRVAEGTHTQADAQAGRLKYRSASQDLTSKGGDLENGKVGGPIMDFEKVPDSAWATYFARHIVAMLMKRYLYFRRDAKAWLFQFMIPVVFLLAGMLIMYFTNFDPSQPVKTLSPGLYNPSISSDRLPTPYSDDSVFCYQYYNHYCGNTTGQSLIMNNITDASTFPVIPVSDGMSIYNVSSYLLNHRNDYKASQFGAATFFETVWENGALSKVSYVVHSNYTAIHATPLFAALVADGIVRSINPQTSVTVKLHPLPSTSVEKALVRGYSVSLVVDFILLAVPYIPAAFATYVVREREVKAKYQQMVSGVSVPAYWLATWIWDNLSFQPTVWLFVILISAFPGTEYLSSITSGALGSVFGLLMLFGGSIAGFVYLFSFMFATPAGAQVTVIYVVMLLGLILSIVGTVLRILNTTHSLYMNVIRYIFCIFPPFALGEGMSNLALIQLWSLTELQGGKTYKVLDMEISGLNLVMMGCECVIYLGLTILYEYLVAIPFFHALFDVSSKHLPEVNNSVKDEDVIAEEQRCLLPDTLNSSTILVKNLKKMYPGGKFAVRGVSLGIPNGECFGLLGINGAGKSTTLSMLSGELIPSSGDIFLSGQNLITDVHNLRRKIGFCPQFDALFEFLTGREHLELYARIKGIAEKDIDRVVRSKIGELGLTEYADRFAGTYSGGNKRKLSVAISMIGEPSIVYLDEPSTGMDPVARRFMWDIISDIVTKRERCSMILTTHSMEESEALCTRIGIMVGGVLRCLGSPQRLRTRYGLGYQVEFGMMVPTGDATLSHLELLHKSLSKPLSEDSVFTRDEILQVFGVLGKASWAERLHAHGSGGDLHASLVSNTTVSGKHFSSWWILEERCDGITDFLTRTFGSFTLRERQISKIRVEIPFHDASGRHRKLSEMFGVIEAEKEALYVREYSVSQTSLEQIFNYFASQQEEETGDAVGIVSGS